MSKDELKKLLYDNKKYIFDPDSDHLKDSWKDFTPEHLQIYASVGDFFGQLLLPNKERESLKQSIINISYEILAISLSVVTFKDEEGKRNFKEEDTLKIMHCVQSYLNGLIIEILLDKSEMLKRDVEKEFKSEV